MPKGSAQEEGWIGRMVGGMVRRSVRARFRNVYWRTPNVALRPPVILAANHHGWHDGYLLFHAITELGVRCVDWVEELDAFPPFRHIGALPFPADDAAVRTATLRKTVRLMQGDGRSLVIFPESVLHRGPEVLPFARTLDWLVKQVPEVSLHPVAIRYEMATHERPEAYVWIGGAVPHQADMAEAARATVVEMLADLDRDIRRGESFEILAKGTLDINERMGMGRRAAKRNQR